jgi:lysophospholipase L1-like esterase
MPHRNRKTLGTILLLTTVLCIMAANTACRDRTPRLQPLPADALILAFGDSLTAGNGAPRQASYPSRLQELTGWRTVNAGVPGEISAEGAKRLPGLLRRHRPDLVVLCHGGNDLLRRIAKQTTSGHLAAMIDMIRRSGAQVVMLAVPQPGIRLRPPDFYRNIAERYRIPLEEEALPAILSDNTLKSDPIHPNAEGYRRLAEAIATLLANSGA